MKTKKITYWISTGIFSAMMLFSAFLYMTSEELAVKFHEGGIPDFLRYELAAGKMLGSLVLLFPFVSARVKEWAYAGFSIVLISAICFHVSRHDGGWTAPLVFFAILMTSLFTSQRQERSMLAQGLNS